MIETVKVVNGYAITRLAGTHGAYRISIREGRVFYTFRTIKAAAAFAASLAENK